MLSVSGSLATARCERVALPATTSLAIGDQPRRRCFRKNDSHPLSRPPRGTSRGVRSAQRWCRDWDRDPDGGVARRHQRAWEGIREFAGLRPRTRNKRARRHGLAGAWCGHRAARAAVSGVVTRSGEGRRLSGVPRGSSGGSWPAQRVAWRVVGRTASVVRTRGRPASRGAIRRWGPQDVRGALELKAPTLEELARDQNGVPLSGW